MSKPIDEQLKELGKRWNTDKENELIDKLSKAIAALKFYASGAEPTKKHPFKEFGCGCCASSGDFDKDDDFDPDYEQVGSEVQGKLARECLKELGEDGE